MGYKFDLVRLGVASRDDETNLVKVQATNPLTDDQDDVEHFGEIDMIQSLGITALPAPPTDGGSATGFVIRDVAGTPGMIVGAFDVRTAKDTFELGPGETCLHSTGEEFESRVFCKEKSVSLVVGTKAVMTLTTLDNGNHKFQVAVGGHMLEISEENGIVLVDAGGAALILKDGQAILKGTIVALGENAVTPLLVAPSPSPLFSKSVLVPVGAA